MPVWVLSNEQDLVDKELSVQELARAVLTHIQGCEWLTGTSARPGAPCEMIPERKKMG